MVVHDQAAIILLIDTAHYIFMKLAGYYIFFNSTRVIRNRIRWTGVNEYNNRQVTHAFICLYMRIGLSLLMQLLSPLCVYTHRIK